MAASSPHALVRPDWLLLAHEEVIEPGLPIIDAHHHLWDRPNGQRYLFDDLLQDMRSGHDIRATVFVQSRSMYRPDLPPDVQPVGEVEFANGIAAQAASGLYGRGRACAAIVGHADLMLADRAEPVLEALIRAGGDRLRGIRNQTAWHPDPAVASNPVPPRPGLLTHPAFAEGVRLLPRFGLTLDVWAYHTQLDEVAQLAASCPETTIILDHCGGPIGVGPFRERRADVLDDWSAAMRRLARQQNVHVKLGGLAMRVGGHDFDQAPVPPSSAQLAEAFHPFIMGSIETFGTGRCLFESNFPVDKGMVSYVALWNAFKIMTKGFSASERRGLFSHNAAALYRLDAAALGLEA